MNKPARMSYVPKVMAFVVLLAGMVYALLAGVGLSIQMIIGAYDGSYPHSMSVPAWSYTLLIVSYGVFVALAFVMAKCVKRWFYNGPGADNSVDAD